MSSTPAVSSSPLDFPTAMRGACLILSDIAIQTLALRILSPKKAFMNTILVQATTFGAVYVVFYFSTNKQITGSLLCYLIYKILRYFFSSKFIPQPIRSPSEISPSSPLVQPQPPSSTPKVTQSSPVTAPQNLHTQSSEGALKTLRTPEARKTAVFEIETQFNAIKDKLTLEFDGTLDIQPDCPLEEISRKLQQQPGLRLNEREEIIGKTWNDCKEVSNRLINRAAEEMMRLLSDLEISTEQVTDPEERKKAQAKLLTDPDFSGLFNTKNRTTFFHIYYFIRNRRYIIHCPNVNHSAMRESKKCVFNTTPKLLPLESEHMKAWRNLFNQIITAYRPLISYLSLPEDLKNFFFVEDDGALIWPSKK